MPNAPQVRCNRFKKRTAVMSNDLVVQLGAKLDQFASDMNRAGDMADSAVCRDRAIDVVQI